MDGVEETVVLAEGERLQETGGLQERGEGVHVGGQDFGVDAVAKRRGLDGVGERRHGEVCAQTRSEDVPTLSDGFWRVGFWRCSIKPTSVEIQYLALFSSAERRRSRFP